MCATLLCLPEKAEFGHCVCTLASFPLWKYRANSCLLLPVSSISSSLKTREKKGENPRRWVSSFTYCAGTSTWFNTWYGSEAFWGTCSSHWEAFPAAEIQDWNFLLTSKSESALWLNYRTLVTCFVFSKTESWDSIWVLLLCSCSCS